MDHNSMTNCISLQKQVAFHLVEGNAGQRMCYSPYPTLPNIKSSFKLSGSFWSFKYLFEQQHSSSSRIETDACHMYIFLSKTTDSSDVELQFFCDSNSKASVGGVLLSQTKWVSLKVAFVNPESRRIASEIKVEGGPHCGKLLCPCRQSKLCLRKPSFCLADFLQSFYVINKCSKPINGMVSTYYCSFDAVVTLTLFPHHPANSVTFSQNHNNNFASNGVGPTPTTAASVNDLYTRSQQGSQVYHAKIETDFKLIAEGKEFPCHKCILAGHSKIFAKMLSPENPKRPGGPNRLVLQNISVLGVESFLKYLYYSDTSFTNFPTYVPFELLKISEKYGISHLTRASCEVLLSKSVDDLDLSSAFQIYFFASSPGFPPLLSSAQYSSLKKIAIQWFIKNYAAFVISEEFTKLFQENRERAQQLLIKIHKDKDTF